MVLDPDNLMQLSLNLNLIDVQKIKYNEIFL